MPSIEPSEVEILLRWNGRLVEDLVMGVLQCDVLQTLVLIVEPVSNGLHLWLVRDRLEIGVEDGALCVESLAVAVAVGGRVETAY